MATGKDNSKPGQAAPAKAETDALYLKAHALQQRAQAAVINVSADIQSGIDPSKSAENAVEYYRLYLDAHILYVQAICNAARTS